jgi:hypothetical protein
VPLDVRVHIPQPIRLEQAPLDVMAKGELTVKVRDAGVETRGAVLLTGGSINLFGHDHPLQDGRITFSAEHPNGWMAVTFAHPLPPEVMRELTKASARAGSTVTLSGDPGLPKVAFGGAGNASLNEVISLNNAGRPVYTSAPDLPASQSVQLPRGTDQLLVLSFLASNMPHMIFLDRIAGWSDPYQGASAYGRIENVEAEHYGDKTRVRAVVRPLTPGRSREELQWDRLFINSDRTAAGVGVRAGSRLGGGLAAFFEWSSAD